MDGGEDIYMVGLMDLRLFGRIRSIWPLVAAPRIAGSDGIVGKSWRTSHRRRWREIRSRGDVTGCHVEMAMLNRRKFGVTGGSVGVATRDVRDGCRVGRGSVEASGLGGGRAANA